MVCEHGACSKQPACLRNAAVTGTSPAANDRSNRQQRRCVYMKQNNYGKGSIYQRQYGRWAAAVCSRDPVTGMDLPAKSKGSDAIHGLTAQSI